MPVKKKEQGTDGTKVKPSEKKKKDIKKAATEEFAKKEIQEEGYRPKEIAVVEEDPYFKHKVVLMVLVAVLLLFNQMQISTVSALAAVAVPFATEGVSSFGSGILTYSGGEYDLGDVDVTKIGSTAQGIAALFPVDEIKSQEDAIAVMIPSGTPEYGVEMGVSYDDPVSALSKLSGAYTALKQMAKEDDEVWPRYLSLAAAPRGISCEFCCGVGAQGVDAGGNLRCGCAHNPGVQSVTLWLMLNTDYSDAEILREVYMWKSLWFPKDMVSLSLQIAGGDTSVLEDLPGMVGGC